MDKLCILVQELLPLYMEKACTVRAAETVEEHLVNCDACWRRLEALRMPLPGESSVSESTEPKKSVKAARLRPTAPFARLWRRALVRAVVWVLAALVAAGALLLTVCTLRGDGYTWFSLPAYITAERLADAVVDMHPLRLRKYVAFTGVGPQDELEMRAGLQELALEDMVVISDGWSEMKRCAADDGVQELSVFFTVDADGKRYTVEFPGSLWEPFAGKAALRKPLVLDNSTGRYVEPEWLDALADALCTHNPG